MVFCCVCLCLEEWCFYLSCEVWFVDNEMGEENGKSFDERLGF